MKIDLTPVLKSLEGNNYKESEDASGKDLTLGKVIAGALGACTTNEPVKAFVMATEFYSKKEIEISIQDMAFVMQVLKDTERWLTHVKGQALFILEEGEKKKGK